MSKKKKQIKERIMTIRRWIILSIYAAISIILPLVIYLVLAKTDKISQKDWIVVIPMIVLVVTFILWNIYGGQVSKNRFLANKVNDSKKRKAYEAAIDSIQSIRRFILLLCGVEFLVIIFMAFVVYFTL